MTLLNRLRKLTGFTYDATESRGRRRQPRTDLRTPDTLLTPHSRRKLLATTRDVNRNMAVAAWAVRKHLDYTSTFRFQPKTGVPEVDDQLEERITWWSKPQNFDVAGRHSRERFIRLIEQRRTIDGDVFILKLKDGRVQAIEGDRVRTPTKDLPRNMDPKAFVHGVQVDNAGRAINYALCDRVGKGFAYRQVLPARHVLQHAFFDHLDQVRGVSPLAAALNAFQDVNESVEYALAKAKVSQLFGLKFTRKGDEPLGDPDGEGELNDEHPYTFDFGAGPQVLDLDEGDDAEFLESKTPAIEFQQFMTQMIAAALKSLDIPYSFFDESHTNYSGARQALLQYEQSAEVKRGDVRLILDDLTLWRLGLDIDDGNLRLPAGMQVTDLRWEWIHSGMPWLDPLKEVNADVAAVGARLRSRQQICKARGTNFFEVADQIAEEEKYLMDRGIAAAPIAITVPAGREKDDE